MLSKLEADYLDWLITCVCDDRHYKYYGSLLSYLHTIPFRWTIAKDYNREEDGINLRFIFAYQNDTLAPNPIDNNSSVLEVLVALARRCEDDIMYSDTIGDRTAQWFWIMIRNLGLSDMDDGRFNEDMVKGAVDAWLDHKYSREGRGSIFYIPNIIKDMRKMEIWYQMQYFLSSIDFNLVIKEDI